MSALCPVCNLTLSSSLIQSHVNSHFEDDETDSQIDSDHYLAVQLASSSSSDHPSSSSNFDDSLGLHNSVASLVHSQTKSQFYSVGHGGLIGLLRNCLESELKSKSKPLECSTSLLCGFVDHFQSSKEDKGWGCGWKNIQMQCSHLISHREEAKRVLFGGSDFVPDIPSLQRWLELAWNKGFDASGALHFKTQIYGSKRWIGTTECAALLRSFGLRARIVDFAPEKSKSMYLSVPGSAIAPKVKSHGPMDRYVVKTGGSGTGKSVDSHGSNSSRITKGAVLMNWVWNYFSDNRLNVSSGVHMTNKGPLYFQHEGHSRTIVGIQRRLQGTTFTPQYNLLVLDSADFTKAIEKALVEKKGWEGYLKRGAHTLKCPEYQMLYVDTGIADREELEKLKTIDSHFVEF
ncbi:zinc finger with UFM1-specific peptidase domain protein [Capsella rubella]|nr:zinc finger with UFM1-specific peptidase domain protein [Capsella rubella]